MNLQNTTKILPRNWLPVSRNETQKAHPQQALLAAQHNTVRINSHQFNKPNYLFIKLFHIYFDNTYLV